MEQRDANLDAVPIQPLKFPAGSVLAPGFIERCLCWLPVLGWIVAAEIARERLRPAREKIAQQLNARPDNVDSAWSGNDRRDKLSRLMRRLAQEAMNWPNDRFIPTDSIEAVFFDDDGDFQAIVSQALEQLQLPTDILPAQEMDRLWAETFGAVVDRLLQMANNHKT